MAKATEAAETSQPKSFYYGWYIVGVGFLANVASAFSLASTLSVFLKSLSADLGVSRGVFSLLRSGEGLIGAFLAPLIGTLMDRYGGRWLMACGAVVAGIGYIVLTQVDSFWQFVAVRWGLVSMGDAFMGYMVINLAVARWFSRRRGRALAFTSMGIGFAKVCMPLVAATLLVWFGWRHTWFLFGIATMILVVGPALIFVRRSPEDMGLGLDGSAAAAPKVSAWGAIPSVAPTSDSDNAVWTRAEAVRTSVFWLLVLTFGVSSVGVTGVNLHVFAYVSDLGYSEVVAATVMSVIASTQLASPLVWGLLAERVDVRYAAMFKFIIQGIGMGLAVISGELIFLYVGFFLYGIGLGGNMVLPDILWANFFGRRSLGKVRGLGLLLTQVFAAMGPPFFGFLFDYTGGYGWSFSLYGASLVASAFLSLMLREPLRQRGV